MRHLATWQAAAAYVRERQLRTIHDGALQVLSRPGLDVTIGRCGRHRRGRAEAIAARLGLPCVTFGALIDAPAEHRALGDAMRARRRSSAAAREIILFSLRM